MNAWVSLPAHVTGTEWRAVQSRLKVDMRSLFAEAGIRWRDCGGRIQLRADNAGPLVYALPLQTAEGRVRADAAKRLARDVFGGGLDGAARQVLQTPGMHQMDIDRWMGLRLAFLKEPDPLTAVRDLVEAQPDCRLYRLGGTPALMRRQVAWRILEHLLDGIAPEDMALGSARRENMLLTGLLEAVPGAVTCAPLTARFQPLAAVLMTSSGAEVAMLSYGSGFVRMPRMDLWPVGVGRPSLTGPGKGIYAVGVEELPPKHADVLLRQAVDGANRLLLRLSDPAQFADANGCLDRDEQMIAWANIRFGFDAVNSMACTWGTTDAIWHAFRALGTLQGIWEGRRQGAVPLRQLLTPTRIRDHVLPTLTDPTHRAWATGLVANYETELLSGFPGQTLEQCTRHLEELRHLVHGVGGQGTRPRNSRLTTLRHLAHHTPNVQLVCDMASLWWTALLLAPEGICRPGRAPWES